MSSNVSTLERISHMVRRLGYGARPDAVAAARDVDDAIGAALDLTGALTFDRLETPASADDALGRDRSARSTSRGSRSPSPRSGRSNNG